MEFNFALLEASVHHHTSEDKSIFTVIFLISFYLFFFIYFIDFDCFCELFLDRFYCLNCVICIKKSLLFFIFLFYIVAFLLSFFVHLIICLILIILLFYYFCWGKLLSKCLAIVLRPIGLMAHQPLIVFL